MLTVVAILIDGMMFASWLFIVAVGLTLIFGVMQILNVTHGSMYAFGAYTSATFIGLYFEGGMTLPAFGSFVVLMLAAIIVGLILGLILERGLLQFMYHRDEIIIVLVTFASFLILEDVLQLIWGAGFYAAYQPLELLGTLEVTEVLVYSNYEIVLIPILSILTGIALWAGLNGTKRGKLLLAVIHDREMAQSFGVNVQRTFTITFVIGAMLGAMGGAFTAPFISVQPGIGVEVIVLTFAVMATGGMGSIPGTAVGAVFIGLTRAFTVHIWPDVELFVIYAVMALVLAFRPQGLFSVAEARKI